MSNVDMKAIFAAQLEKLNLDRAGTIEQAAAIIADLSQRLGEAEARASNTEIQNRKYYNELEFYRRSADDAFYCAQIALEAGKKFARAINADLPQALENLNQHAMNFEKKRQAVVNVQKKLANDPKQIAKDEILAKWSDWHYDHQHQYKDNTDFAEGMLKEHSATLESVVQITQWCGEWSKVVVVNCWEKMRPQSPSPDDRKKFAAIMKGLIKTLKPHIVIGWCESSDKSSNL